MKTNIFAILFISFWWIASTGCKKEADFLNASVIYAGLPEADGCGWLIVTDSVGGNGQYYKAINLPTEFQINHLDVRITYNSEVEKYYCGFASTAIPKIKLNTIKKR